MMLPYHKRRRLIRSIIFWMVIIFGLLALFLIQSRSLGSTVNSNTRNSNFGISQINVYAVNPTPAPIDPCDVNSGVGGCLLNSARYNTLTSKDGIVNFAIDLIRSLIYISAALAVGFIVYGGFLMLTSAGDDGKYGNGIKTLQYAVLGLIVIGAASTIVYVVTTLLQNFQF